MLLKNPKFQNIFFDKKIQNFKLQKTAIDFDLKEINLDLND